MFLIIVEAAILVIVVDAVVVIVDKIVLAKKIKLEIWKK